MKNILKTIVVVFMAFTAMSTKASDDLDLKVNNKQNLVMHIEKIEKGAELILKDENDLILFKNKFFEENSYSKTLDFNNLPDGDYKLILDKQFAVLSTMITKKGEKITVENPDMNIAFKPCFKIDNDKVYFYIANPGSSNAILEIFNSRGLLVGKAKSTDVIFKKTLDFSNAGAGDYYAKVKLNDQYYTKKLTL